MYSSYLPSNISLVVKIPAGSLSLQKPRMGAGSVGLRVFQELALSAWVSRELVPALLSGIQLALSPLAGSILPPPLLLIGRHQPHLFHQHLDLLRTLATALLLPVQNRASPLPRPCTIRNSCVSAAFLLPPLFLRCHF